MTAAPIIRRAHLDDHAACCALLEQVDRLHREALPWMFREAPREPRPAADFAAMLDSPEAAVFVADAGSVVGVAMALLRSTPEHPLFQPRRYGLLDNLVIDAGWRGRGLGRALTAAFEDWALAQGAAWLEVNVYTFNADASGAYASMGYAPLSQRLRKPRPG